MRAGIIALVLASLGACTSNVDYRGYLPKQGDLQRVQVGMAKTEVEALLGSPSTTATVNYSGDSYYYISSVMEERGFLDPEETDRKVFAVRFDQGDRVQSFANYGLQDGQIVDFNTRETPTKGREYTFLQQIFGNIGAFTPNQTPPGQGRVGQPVKQ
ncbi:MAG: outer membrane protein assembly factor BamE [Parvibaculaceae bacterium]